MLNSNMLVVTRAGVLLALVILAAGLLTAGASTAPWGDERGQIPPQPESIEAPQRVRLYLQHRGEAGQWSDAGIDVPEYVFDSDRPGYLGYVLVDVAPAEYSALRSKGTAMEVMGPAPEPNWDPACYSTYEQIVSYLQRLAADYPNLVTLTDIGDSWEKLNPAPGRAPRDIWRLRLTNSARPGAKPVFYLVAAHHAREIATPALTLAWIARLVGQYGRDAQVTALLDDKEIWVVPLQNPDGYAKVVTGQLSGGQEWRKNTNNSSGCVSGSYGTDTNRNYDAVWGGPCPVGGCASTNCASQTYRGPAPASEPEVQAMQNDFLAAGTDLMLSLHTYGPLVLYPYGNSTEDPPDLADLDAMAWNFARINGNTPRNRTGQPPEVLYGVTGTTDEWTYRGLGIPSFTIELGGYPGFDMPCSVLPGVVDTYLPVLDYVAQVTDVSTRTTYDRAWGPAARDVAVRAVGSPAQIEVTAVLSSNYGLPMAAEYFIDEPGANGGGTAMAGGFGGGIAAVAATFDATALPQGRHTIYVRGKNDQNRWGVAAALFFTLPLQVATPTATATSTATATATSTACDPQFVDVGAADYFYEAVRYLYCAGAISGYDDGTFRPFSPATRGQITKILVLAEGFPIVVPGAPTFRDVPANNPFYPYVETAAARNIVAGYSDGTFRWQGDVTRGQLSKMVVVAEGWPLVNPAVPTFADVRPDNPFYVYVETAVSRGIVGGYDLGGGLREFRWAADATRGQISKIIHLAVAPAE